MEFVPLIRVTYSILRQQRQTRYFLHGRSASLARNFIYQQWHQKSSIALLDDSEKALIALHHLDGKSDLYYRRVLIPDENPSEFKFISKLFTRDLEKYAVQTGVFLNVVKAEKYDHPVHILFVSESDEDLERAEKQIKQIIQEIKNEMKQKHCELKSDFLSKVVKQIFIDNHQTKLEGDHNVLIEFDENHIVLTSESQHSIKNAEEQIMKTLQEIKTEIKVEKVFLRDDEKLSLRAYMLKRKAEKFKRDFGVWIDVHSKRSIDSSEHPNVQIMSTCQESITKAKEEVQNLIPVHIFTEKIMLSDFTKEDSYLFMIRSYFKKYHNQYIDEYKLEKTYVKNIFGEGTIKEPMGPAYIKIESYSEKSAKIAADRVRQHMMQIGKDMKTRNVLIPAHELSFFTASLFIDKYKEKCEKDYDVFVQVKGRGRKFDSLAPQYVVVASTNLESINSAIQSIKKILVQISHGLCSEKIPLSDRIIKLLKEMDIRKMLHSIEEYSGAYLSLRGEDLNKFVKMSQEDNYVLVVGLSADSIQKAVKKFNEFISERSGLENIIMLPDDGVNGCGIEALLLHDGAHLLTQLQTQSGAVLELVRPRGAQSYIRVKTESGDLEKAVAIISEVLDKKVEEIQLLWKIMLVHKRKELVESSSLSADVTKIPQNNVNEERDSTDEFEDFGVKSQQSSLSTRNSIMNNEIDLDHAFKDFFKRRKKRKISEKEKLEALKEFNMFKIGSQENALSTKTSGNLKHQVNNEIELDNAFIDFWNPKE